MADDGSAGSGLPHDVQAFLDAVVATSSEPDLHRVLERIVASACALTGARHGGLSVLGDHGELVDFVSTGPTVEEYDAVAAGDGLVVPVRIRGTVFGRLHLTDKAGEDAFSGQDRALVTGLAQAVSVVIDNARSFAQSERRRRWLEASAWIVEALQPPVRLDEALARIVAGVRSVMSAAAVAVVRSSADGYVAAAADGAEAAGLGDLLPAIQTELRLADSLVELAVLPAGERPVVVLVPLRAQLAAAGVLVVVLPGDGGPLAAEEPELLASFADQASLALDRAHAVSERDELMVVQDRERIARDLHDLVIQRLFATGLHLQAARNVTMDIDMRARLDAAVVDLDLTIRDIRSTIFDLRRTRDPSLRADVRAVAREYVPVLGFTPVVRTAGAVDTTVPTAHGGHLLAVLREALSNIARHAAADAVIVAVEVSTGPGRLLLRVTDDGRGVPADHQESGLRNVRRRASELGGTVQLVAEQPHGTRLDWTVPLPGLA